MFSPLCTSLFLRPDLLLVRLVKIRIDPDLLQLSDLLESFIYEFGKIRKNPLTVNYIVEAY